MRSRLIRAARPLDRCSGQRPAPLVWCSGARWSTSTGRQWSTPLAKTLHEAITVRCNISKMSISNAQIDLDHRSDTSSLVYATMPHFRSRRLLYIRSRTGTRSVRQEGRLCHITRDLTNLRRAHRAVVRRRMDVSGAEKCGCLPHGDGSRKRHVNGRHAQGMSGIRKLRKELSKCLL